MMLKTIVFFWMFVYVMPQIVFQDKQPECQVIQQSDKSFRLCQFPFRYRDKLRIGCINEDDPDGRFWCSTQIFPNRTHIPRQNVWGYCDEPGVRCNNDESEGISDEVYETVKTTVEELVGFEVDFLNQSFIKVQKSLAGSHCKCINIDTCQWSNKLLSLLKSLPKDHYLTDVLNDIINVSQCANKRVRCCNPSLNVTTPDPSVGSSNSSLDVTTSSDPSVRSSNSSLDVTTPDPSVGSSNSSLNVTAQLPIEIEEDNNQTELGTWKPSESKGDCGKKISAATIVGGKDASVGEFTYMALLATTTKKGDNIFHCGGTLINKWYVVTAAHCQTSGSNIERVILGELILNQENDCDIQGFCAPPIQVIEVAEVIVHENWNSKQISDGFDIALVRLKNPATLFYDGDSKNSYVVPICLPWAASDPGRDLSDSDELITTGWGRLNENIKEYNRNIINYGAGSQILQKVDLYSENCTDLSLYNSTNSDKLICAIGDPGKDSCSGDSGGPLAYRIGSSDPWYLVGIVSYGSIRCGMGMPGVYTRITSYLPWIEKQLKP